MAAGLAEQRNPNLWAALEAGVEQIEISIARTGQMVSVVGVVMAVYFGFFVATQMGATLAVIAAWSLGWFTISHYCISKRIYIEVIRWVSPVVEITVPTAVLVVLGRTEGAAYALGSWVPPELYCIFILASILRLRMELPLTMGVFAAIEYIVVYYFFLRGNLGDASPLLLYGDRVQIVRACSLVLAGGAGSFAVLGIRHLINKANEDVRAQELFGKYRLGEEVASGGMGRVYRATYCPEGGFEREVAIKLIHPHLAKDPDIVDRFRQEARLSARLGHPNIVAALDFGKVRDTYFFAMEFVDGPSLRDVVNHHRGLGLYLPTNVVAHVSREIAEGLHFAHSVAKDRHGRILRVVHRDLSPANVLLDRSGMVKISDFGVARALRQVADSHTRTLVGKPSYMAPEHLRGEAVDERSDLFALGILIWEMLCLQRLFWHDNEAATMRAVLEAQVAPPSSIRPGVDPHWDALVAGLLERDPTKRIASAADASDALATILGIEGAAHPEEVADLVRATVDIPELDLDPETQELDKGA